MLSNLKDLLNPLKQEVYRVILPQIKLNEVLKKELLKNNTDLKKVSLILTNNMVHIRGVAKTPPEVKLTKSPEVSFDITLEKENIRGTEIIFHIKKFRFYVPNKSIDLLKIVNHFTNLVREFVLKDITSGNSPLTLVTPYTHISIDLNSFLEHLPPEANLIGNLSIHNLSFQPRRVVIFVSSTIVFKNLLQIFTPYSIKIEKIDTSIDPISLLIE